MTVPYRLVFVDVDGVLNNKDDARGHINGRLVASLGAMVRARGASIVLSSAWRLTRESREQVKAAFLRYGVPMPISCTPHIAYEEGQRYARVQEILAWLQTNTDLAFQPADVVRADALYVECDFDTTEYRLPMRVSVSHFVALDDIDMRQHGGAARALVAARHFVLTFMQTGLTEHNLRQAQHILSDEYPAIDMLTPTATTLSSCLPLCEECEQCQTGRSSVYDVAVNKYFCGAKCLDHFYVLHYGTPYCS